jgi:glucose-1-phosphate thymidylyltransferase
LFDVLNKGILVVPNATRWTGPWLGATRRPSLQKVANRSIVCHALDAMLEADIADVAILLPADATAEISACISAEGPPSLNVRYLELEGPDDRDSALAAATEFAGGETCVLHQANGLLGQPLVQFVEALGSDSLDALLLVRDDGQETRRLKLVTQRPLRPVDNATPGQLGGAGVCLLGPGSLERLAGMDSDQLGSWCSEYPLDPALLAQALARAGARVHTRVVQRWRSFAGDAHDLLDMNRMMLDKLDPEATTVATDGNRFEGSIVIHPTACVSSSVIVGPVIIGADALIADSYIGPHTSIAERVRIEGAELERTIVLADASLLHVGGRLVASVVGREARIFRDFSMPRALRLQVGDGDEVALC